MFPSHDRQGFTIPKAWNQFGVVDISQAIGNGVPVYMSQAFGEAYSKPNQYSRQLELFDLMGDDE